MNKLLVGNDDDINDVIVSDEDMYIMMDFNSTSKPINIDIMDNMNLMVFEKSKNTKNTVVYNLRSNSTLIINKLAIDNNDTVTVNLLGYGANVVFNNSVISYNDSICKETINHLADNTKSRLVNHGINTLDNTLNFSINGVVKKSFKECFSIQDNRIINLGNGKSAIFPNLIVDSNAVDIFHSAYIGSFDEEIMFYLQSRGISRKDCHNLLIKGFLIGSMKLDDKEKEELDTIINNV